MLRAEKLSGATYKLRWPDSEPAIYVTVNDIETDGVRRPFEVFVNCKNLEHYAWVVALTRMISAVFRRGGEVAFVAEQLKQVFDPRGGQWTNGRYVGSLVAAIGDIIERHMIDTGFLTPAEPARTESAHPTSSPSVSLIEPLCPKCSQPGLVREAGCLSCLHCGWSKCSWRQGRRQMRPGPARRPNKAQDLRAMRSANTRPGAAMCAGASSRPSGLDRR